MKAFFRSILGGLITLAALLFALANRQDVAVVWSPAHDPANISASALVLGALAVGFLLGAMMTALGRKKKS